MKNMEDWRYILMKLREYNLLWPEVQMYQDYSCCFIIWSFVIVVTSLVMMLVMMLFLLILPTSLREKNTTWESPSTKPPNSFRFRSGSRLLQWLQCRLCWWIGRVLPGFKSGKPWNKKSQFFLGGNGLSSPTGWIWVVLSSNFWTFHP